jgi:V8-like Glu-specific endopeptidase
LVRVSRAISIITSGLILWSCGHSRALAGADGGSAQVRSDRAGKVFGDDERHLIDNTTAQPWSSIGMVVATFHDGPPEPFWSFGTGCLIGTRTVITSAHIIWDETYGWADTISFSPGKDGPDEPFGSVAVETAIPLPGYTGTNGDDHDIILLILDTPVGEQAGYLQVAMQPDWFFPNRQLNLAGYPGDLGLAGPLYHAVGLARDLDELVIRHTIDSAEGQSGAPVWYEDDSGSGYYLVGVHKGDREIYQNGTLVDEYNIAVHINESVYNWIRDQLSARDTVELPELSPAADPLAGLLCPAAAVALPMLLCLCVFGAHTRRR